MLKNNNRLPSLPHPIIFGATGMGKTQSLTRLISNATQSGNRVVIIDVKDALPSEVS